MKQTVEKNLCKIWKPKLLEKFQITEGLKQRSYSAFTVFKIYLREALEKWRKQCRNMEIPIDEYRLLTPSFADDQVILVEKNITEPTNNKAE